MTDDRLMIAEAVFKGQIGEEYLTQAEVDEVFLMVAEEAMKKNMELAQARGCNVFVGYEDPLVH